jgi:hypothetical protein
MADQMTNSFALAGLVVAAFTSSMVFFVRASCIAYDGKRRNYVEALHVAALLSFISCYAVTSFRFTIDACGHAEGCVSASSWVIIIVSLGINSANILSITDTLEGIFGVNAKSRVYPALVIGTIWVVYGLVL